jgi:hypothetical protein
MSSMTELAASYMSWSCGLDDVMSANGMEPVKELFER